MLNQKVADLLNVQINKELYSAYLYLHFSNFYHEQGLDGFANWYQVQAQAIYEAAYEARDFRTMQFLDWFVKEQGEEETNASDLVKKMELFGGDAKALYMLDSELGGRTYSAPSLVL